MTDPRIDYLEVWQSCPPDRQLQVRALWQSLGVVEDPADAEERLTQLCILACRQDKVVGVSTAKLATVEQLGAEFFLFRCLVHPDLRRLGIARQLTVRCRDRLAAWSRAHPEAKALGMATVVESPALDEFSRIPVWPASGMGLIGYTPQRQQVRVVWFEHARLEH